MCPLFEFFFSQKTDGKKSENTVHSDTSQWWKSRWPPRALGRGRPSRVLECGAMLCIAQREPRAVRRGTVAMTDSPRPCASRLPPPSSGNSGEGSRPPSCTTACRRWHSRDSRTWAPISAGAAAAFPSCPLSRCAPLRAHHEALWREGQGALGRALPATAPTPTPFPPFAPLADHWTLSAVLTIDLCAVQYIPSDF